MFCNPLRHQVAPEILKGLILLEIVNKLTSLEVFFAILVVNGVNRGVTEGAFFVPGGRLARLLSSLHLLEPPRWLYITLGV